MQTPLIILMRCETSQQDTDNATLVECSIFTADFKLFPLSFACHYLLAIACRRINDSVVAIS